MHLDPVKREFCLVTPVVYISTTDENGVLNVAPYSNLMPILRSTDLVCISSWHRRDTLRNIRNTKEFVLSVPPSEMAPEVMQTAVHYPSDVNEFKMAGLLPRPTKNKNIPGVEGCIAWMVCRLVKQYIEKKYVLVIGEVMDLEIEDRFIDADGGFNKNCANPLLACLNSRGINFATIKMTGYFEKYEAMFPDKKDVLAHIYNE